MSPAEFHESCGEPRSWRIGFRFLKCREARSRNVGEAFLKVRRAFLECRWSRVERLWAGGIESVRRKARIRTFKAGRVVRVKERLRMGSGGRGVPNPTLRERLLVFPTSRSRQARTFRASLRAPPLPPPSQRRLGSQEGKRHGARDPSLRWDDGGGSARTEVVGAGWIGRVRRGTAQTSRSLRAKSRSL